MNRLIACMLILSAGACASDESTRSHTTTVRAHDDNVRRHHRERVADTDVNHDGVVDSRDRDWEADHRGERAEIAAQPSAVKPVAVATVPAEAADGRAVPADRRVTEDGRVVPADRRVSDSELTRRIRKAVTDDNRLSPAAKNAKIVTKDGRVTLQGSVPSDVEKDAVDGHARDVAGASNVDNQLVIR